MRRLLHKGRVMSILMRRTVALTLLLSAVVLMAIMLVIQSGHDDEDMWYLSRSGDVTLQNLNSPLVGDASGGHCRARRSIVFIKTHKCGSSTVQNILLRHGERFALDFVLPARGNYIGSPEPFRASWIPEDLRPRSGRFHIFTHHTRLNIAETRRVMYPDAAWVTILRDPVDQFESGYDYIGYGRKWGVSLEEFIKLPLEEKLSKPRVGKRFGVSQMTFDLGYDPAIVSEPRLVAAMLQELEQTFDLVMIMELMDESLVLLRRLMCWSTDDVTYLAKNARFESRRTRLTKEQRASLEEFLALDMILYNHFRRRLAERIVAVPLEAFLTETETLVARRLFWRQQCVVDTVNGSALTGQQHEITDKVQGYRLSDSSDWMCSRLGMAELGYTDLVRDAQRERLAVWHRVYAMLGANSSAPLADQG